MPIKSAIVGLIIGALVWHTDTFQRLAFPLDYWTEKVNKIDSDIAFTQSLIDAKDAQPDEVDMWQEYIGYEREDRKAAMEALIQARWF